MCDLKVLSLICDVAADAQFDMPREESIPLLPVFRKQPIRYVANRDKEIECRVCIVWICPQALEVMAAFANKS